LESFLLYPMVNQDSKHTCTKEDAKEIMAKAMKIMSTEHACQLSYANGYNYAQTFDTACVDVAKHDKNLDEAEFKKLLSKTTQFTTTLPTSTRAFSRVFKSVWTTVLKFKQPRKPKKLKRPKSRGRLKKLSKQG